MIMLSNVINLKMDNINNIFYAFILIVLDRTASIVSSGSFNKIHSTKKC